MDKSKPLTARFLTYFKRHFPNGTPRFLLTVSGGIDSVVMADLFHFHQIPFGMAHVNFELRGEDSEADQQFTEALAARYRVPFHTARLNAEAAAKAPGVSVQMAARHLRYEWFEAICSEGNYNFICTAHHANDVMETLLYNLSKGTGLAGLHGIFPLRKTLFRPLLEFTKEEIKEYAEEKGLQWREDRSNASEKYARNLLRHRVSPVLQQLNPEVEKAFGRTAQRIRQAENILSFSLEQWKRAVFKKEESGFRIDEEVLLRLPEPEFLLQQWLSDYGFSTEQISTIWEKRSSSATAQTVGKTYHSSSHTIHKERKGWFLSKRNRPVFSEEIVIEKGMEKVESPFGSLYFSEHSAQGHILLKDASFATLDLEKLAFPLKLRVWQEGDIFRPLGMRGFKKVSDFLTDLKIPSHQKKNGCVLLSSNEICWVVGLRIDDRFKKTGNTSRILEISHKKNGD